MILLKLINKLNDDFVYCGGLSILKKNPFINSCYVITLIFDKLINLININMLIALRQSTFFLV